MISRLKFLYGKNQFLDVSLCRLLRNALIQPHFNYNCTAWYQDLTKKRKKKEKSQGTQNEWVKFCLKLKCREHK